MLRFDPQQRFYHLVRRFGLTLFFVILKKRQAIQDHTQGTGLEGLFGIFVRHFIGEVMMQETQKRNDYDIAWILPL